MTKTAPKHDPTPAFARQVLELYVEALPDVRFPDLDLALLQSAREELLLTQLQIDGIEADLDRARAALDAQAAALNALAERALAYARVFASGDEALHARIAETGRKKAVPVGEGTQPKRRRRLAKSETGSELFGSHGSRDDTARESGDGIGA
jgi:multidrug efflux pump subunit AcrA (membrane-fusion protein)